MVMLMNDAPGLLLYELCCMYSPMDLVCFTCGPPNQDHPYLLNFTLSENEEEQTISSSRGIECET